MGGKSSCCLKRQRQKSNSRPPCYGLIIVPSRQPVPLQGISVDVQVKGFVADVSATLKYKNEEKKAVEGFFVLPMDKDFTIYSFEATIEGKTIMATLQEKTQAHRSDDEAVSQGQEAFLYLEEDESLENMFCCSVGSLPPGQEAVVTLKYVQELAVETDGAVRLVIPPILTPSCKPECHSFGRAITSPRNPYTLSLGAHFKSAYGISKIESNCDITALEYTDNDKTGAKVSLVEGHKFDRDVELLAYYEDLNIPSVTVEAGLGSAVQGEGEVPSESFMVEPVAMLNFYPYFPASMEESSCKEFIFLVDRSASMKCTITTVPDRPRRIENAKKTLVLLLKSLPLGCYFNIVGFGSHFECLFQESVEYTQQTMEEALKMVDMMEANLEGTQILEPLKTIYGTARKDGFPLQLFVLTDGAVQNTKEVIAEVQKNAENHRCFTFGIGCGASTPLVEGMARAGNGTFEFIANEDRMQPKVLQTLKWSLQPIARNMTLTWTRPSSVRPTVLSGLPSGVLRGERLIVYVQLKGQVENDTEGELCLQYELQDKIVKNDIHFPLNMSKAERSTIHRLAAKALISELDHGTESHSEEVKKKILETSLQSGVVSSLTAYVAVNKDTKTRVKGPAVRRDVPAPGEVTPSTSTRRAWYHFGHILHPNAHSHHMTATQYQHGGHFHRVPWSDSHAIHGHIYDGPEAVSLISFQNADGSWNLSPKFSAALGVSQGQIMATNPDQNMDVSVWVTVLAVIWLHSSCLDQRYEWELLKEKAVSWVRARVGSSLGELVRAGNELLKSSVNPNVFGL